MTLYHLSGWVANGNSVTPVFPRLSWQYQEASFVSLSHSCRHTPLEAVSTAVHPEPALAFLAFGADAYKTAKNLWPR